MKYLFTTLSLLAIITIKAQTSGQIANYGSTATSGADANAQLNAVLGPMQEAEAKLTYKKEEFQGSPYTHDLFLPTNLFYKNEDLGLIFYRYNAYNEEIEIKRQNIEGEGIQALGRDKQISIRVNNKPMSFKTFIDDKGLTQNGYLTKLVDGKYSIYKRVDVKFTEGQKSQNSFVPAIPARFSKFTEYYLELEGRNKIEAVDLSNRKLIKLLPDEEKAKFKAYLKENNIKIRNEEDLTSIVNFLNNEFHTAS